MGAYKNYERIMSELVCEHCRGQFEARHVPVCPTCLVASWLATENFVRPKHDQRLLPLAWESYRSVLSPSFVESPAPQLEFAAQSGTWFRDLHYELFVHMTHSPLDLHPGAGIPEGKTMPEHSLDSLLIAEANSATEAHAFAVSRTQFEAQIRAGEFQPLPVCCVAPCDNLVIPGGERCAGHDSPSVADSR